MMWQTRRVVDETKCKGRVSIEAMQVGEVDAKTMDETHDCAFLLPLALPPDLPPPVILMKLGGLGLKVE